MKLINTSFVERLFYKLSKNGSCLLNGLIITHINENAIKFISDCIIKEAMFHLYKRHPLLQCHIHKTRFRRKIYFAVPENDTERRTIEDMKFEKVRIASKEELVSILENFNVELFDYEKKCLMFKLKVFEWKQENDKDFYAFSLTVPHCLSDGINITTLCIEFVNILNSLLQNIKFNEISEQLEVIDTADDQAKKSLITDEIKAKFKNRKKNEKTIKFRTSIELANKDAESSTKINLLMFDENFTNKLISYAKSNGIKLTGILTVAMFNATKELYKENKLEFPKDVSLLLPVSLRHRIKPTVDNADMRFLVMVDCLKIKNFGECETFADESRNVDKILVADLDDGLIFDGLLNPILRIVSVIMEHLSIKILNKLMSKTPSNFCISNIGTYAADKQKMLDGPLKVEEIYFGDVAFEYGGIALFVQTFNNKLMIRLSTNRKALDSKHSDRFMNLFEKQLKGVIME